MSSLIKKLSIEERLSALSWETLRENLLHKGFATTGPILTSEECRTLSGLYEASPDSFRSRVVMQRYAFGKGEYQYFRYPLPEMVESIRHRVYPQLASLANQWESALGKSPIFPDKLETFLSQCHQAGQLRPTPLLLKYEPGDYNCLHQDLYGDHVFPIQMTLLLSEPGRDFSGGEFVLVEQRPRMQSRPTVVSLQQGEAVLFAVNQRPVQGSRGFYRVMLKHGVSEIHTGQRYSLGIIFHDAK